MTNEQTPSALLKARELKPQFGCKVRRQGSVNQNGRIVSDWFKCIGDDRSWCYVMYENEAGHCHMVEAAQFFLPEGHQHYDLKVDVIESPNASILSELEKVTKERDEHEKKRKESHALFLKAHTEECRLATENKALLDFVENQPCLCGIDFDCKRCTLLNSFHKTL